MSVSESDCMIGGGRKNARSILSYPRVHLNQSGIWGGGDRGDEQVWGGTKGGGGHPFLGERVGGVPLFQTGRKKICLFRAFFRDSDGTKMLKNCLN
jgi:hypothetical protein